MTWKYTFCSGPLWSAKRIPFRLTSFKNQVVIKITRKKKTRPKRIFSTVLHVAVFNEHSTDWKLTMSPIDPCQSRQKRRCRDRYTKITNLCFSPFFKWNIWCFCWFVIVFCRINGNGRTDIEKDADGHWKTRTDIEKHAVGRTDGRTDARNFVHRGRRVFFGGDPLFWFPFQSRVP